MEDTVNLLGHAGGKVAECAAKILARDHDRVCIAADSPVLLGSSIKRALRCGQEHDAT